jgi:hypothetical protein
MTSQSLRLRIKFLSRMNWFLRPVVLLSVVLLILSTTIGKTTAQTPQITVRADSRLGPINPFVFGANYGPWAIIAPDMTPTAIESGVTYLRFPAGNWGDDNDLTPFHIDLFMKFARQMRAEPSISVRLKNGTAEAAAKVVKYVNIEKKYGVRYWSVGNEPDLFPNYSIEQYVKDWRKIAEAMKAVDPSIILVGPDTSKYHPHIYTDDYANARRAWVTEFLKANGDMVDIVAVHHYPFPLGRNQPATTIAQLRDNSPEWDMIVTDLRKVVKDTTGKDLPVAITEVNSRWDDVIGGEGTPDSFYNGIWWGDVLTRLIRQKVDIVAYFNLYTSSSPSSYGLISRYEPRPTYYVYQMYKRFGTELVESESSDPMVTVAAALAKNGALTVMVINRGADEKTLTLDLHGATVNGNADVWRFDAEHKAEQVGTAGLSMGTVPGHSISLYVYPANEAR